jgi:pilus assembly protein CpaB
MILENVRIVTAGTSLQNENNKPQNVPIVTLLMSPAESQKLTLASADGKIQLALRNPLDQRQENPEAVKKEALYRGPSALMEVLPAEVGVRPRAKRAVPAPILLPVFTVEVIQGQKRDRLTFEEAQP